MKAQVLVDELMLRRALKEFAEMPGLHVTCQQAQRLWEVDETSCRQVLEFLVEVGFLSRRQDGVYTRRTGSARTSGRRKLVGQA